MSTAATPAAAEDADIGSVLKMLRAQYSTVNMDPRKRPDWGLLPDADDTGDPYQLLASMEDQSRLTSVMRMDDDPAIDALIEMHNRVNLILYGGQKRKYRLAQNVMKQLDNAAEMFTAEHYAELAAPDETYEAYVEKEMKRIAIHAYAGLLDVGKWVGDETMDEMHAFHGLELNGRSIEEFSVFTKIKNGFKKLGSKIKDGFKYLKDKVGALVKKIGDGFKEVIEGIKDLTHDVVDAFNAITKKILKPIGNFFKKIIDTVVMKPVNWIKNAAKKIWSKIKEVGVKIKNALVAAFNKVKEVVVKVIAKLRDGLLKAFRAIKTAFIKLGKSIEAFGNAFANFFKNIFKKLANVFKSIGNFFKKVFNGIKSGFWWVINKFKAGWNFVKCGVLNIAPWIKGVFKNFFLFFKNVLGVLKLLLKFLAQLVQNPFKALFKIIVLLLGLVFSIFLLLVYTILSLGPAAIIGFVYSWAAALVLTILETFIYVNIALLSTVVFIGVWILNVMSGGFLTFLLRCENRPDTWFNASGYEAGNIYKRFLMCYWPCSAGFEKKWGYVCVKKQQSCPKYCPQQQIFGILEQPEERDRLQPYMFDRFVPDARFYTTPLMQKREILLKTMQMKKEFLGSCMTALKPYDFMNRTICANIGNLDPEKYPPALRAKLANVCKQAYCDYEVVKDYTGKPIATYTGASWAGSWCKRLLDLAGAVSPQGLTFDASREFLEAIFLLIVGTVVAIITVTIKGYMSVSAVKMVKTNPYIDMPV